MVGLEKARKRARNAIEGLYEGIARIYTYESKYDKEISAAEGNKSKEVALEKQKEAELAKAK